MPLVPQTAAATSRVRCALVCLLFALGSSAYSQVVVFLFIFFSKCLSTSLAGTHTTVCSSYCSSFFFSFDMSSLFMFFSFVSFRLSIS